MPADPDPHCPGASVDEPVAGTPVLRSPAFVRGWAMFASESVARVQLTVDGRPLGVARVGLLRPDVAAVSTSAGAATSGWEYELGADPGLPDSGVVTLGGAVHGSGGSTLDLPTVTVRLADGWSEPPPVVRPAMASMDGRPDGHPVQERPAFVHGWAILPSESVARVQLTVDGRPLGAARVGLDRPDVVAAVPGCAEAVTSGWAYELGADPGLPDGGVVTLGGVVHGSAGTTISLPTVEVQLTEGWARRTAGGLCPGASIDEPAAGSHVDRLPTSVRGWAMLASESVARVELTLDGSPLGRARIGLPRPDLALACGCSDAPISGWELELERVVGLPAGGTVTLGGVVHGSAGTTMPLPARAVDLGPSGPPPPARPTPRAPRHARPDDRRDAPPNVLVLAHSLGYGGAQLYLLELLERLSAHGLRFTVVAPADGPLRERFEGTGAHVHLVPLPARWEQESYDPWIAELLAFAAPQPFDLVVGNTILLHPCAEVAQSLGVPSILAVHESFDLHTYWATQLEPQDPAVFARLATALASASAIVFEAAATRELFLPYARPERLLAMPYGIDLEAIARFRAQTSRRAARAALGIGDEQQLVLCLGTIEARKAQASLARAFGRIAGHHPDAVLALVGEQPGAPAAPYDAGLAEFLRRAGLTDRVLIAPLTAEPFLWHAAADVLVCASDIESLPRVILEAMAFETLVVSTDIFGVPEVIEHGVTGFLCASRDEQAIAAALDEALRPRADHDDIRSAAVARVHDRHDADDYAERFLELIGTLADGARAQPSGVEG